MYHWITNLSRRQKRSIMLSVDLILVPVAYLLSLLLQSAGAQNVSGALSQNWLILPLLVLLTATISTFLQIPNIRLNSYDIKGMGRIAVLACLVSFCAMALNQISTMTLSLSTFVVFGLIYFLACVTVRLVMLEILVAVYRRNNGQCRVLIYGAGATGMQLARALTTHEAISAVAFIDDNVALQGLTVHGLPVLRPKDLATIIAERRVDRVLLAMPSLSRPKQMQIVRRLEAMKLEVQALPSFAQLIGEEALINRFKPISSSQIIRRKAFDHDANASAAYISGRSVLVSGGGGSIGSELCRQILSCKAQKLVILEVSELALYEAEKALHALAKDAGVALVSVLGSVTEARLVRRVIQDHDVNVIFHAAAYKHVPIVEANPLAGMANNVLGTQTLAREADRAGVDRFILVSSDKAVRPTNVMGASKRLAELVVQDLAARSDKTIFSMVRFGNVIGSSGSVVPLFSEQIARGGPLTLTHPDVSRYFMAVEEAVSLVLAAGSFAVGGEVFVLDMGRPKKIIEIARQVIHDAGFTVRDADNPDGDIEIKTTGLRPGEKLTEELLIGEGHTTTANEKIFAAREVHLSEIEVAKMIRSLREALAAGDDAAARAVAQEWVEGYGSAARNTADTASADPA